MADTEDTETLAELLWSVDGEYSDVACEMVLASSWLAARDERIRADEREKLAGEVARLTGPLPKNETPDDLRWYATHEALARHSIFDVLMWLADARAGEVEAR